MSDFTTTERSGVYAALFSALLLTNAGCSSHSCNVSPSGPASVEIWHSSGGAVPIVSSIAIGADGSLKFTSPRGKGRCAHLKPQDQEHLREALGTPGLSKIVAEASERGEAYFDYEGLEIRTSLWAGAMPMELVPQELMPFLKLIETILDTYFGVSAPWADQPPPLLPS